MKTILAPMLTALIPGAVATTIASDAVDIQRLVEAADTSHVDVDALVVPTPELAAVPVQQTTPVVEDASVRPSEWQRRLRRCHSGRNRRRFCDGPRMVPVPSSEAAARADELGIGKRRTVSSLLVRAPEPRWVDAVDGDPEETMEWPVPGGTLGRGVGYVRRASLRHIRHQGIDISAHEGAEVVSVGAGLVAYADNGVSGYGNLVVIVHRDGSTTAYAHLKEAWVTAGQRVARGQTVGLLGNTGLSHGPHLHFEWRVGGRAQNPVPHMVGRPGGDDSRVVALADR